MKTHGISLGLFSPGGDSPLEGFPTVVKSLGSDRASSVCVFPVTNYLLSPCIFHLKKEKMRNEVGRLPVVAI